MQKQYRIMHNVGKAKYVVSYHDGVKTHRDGSPFFDINIFSNKVAFAKFINKLNSDKYTER